MFCKTNKHKRTLKSITENFCDNMIHTVIVCAIYTKQQVCIYLCFKRIAMILTYYILLKYYLVCLYFLSDTIGGISQERNLCFYRVHLFWKGYKNLHNLPHDFVNVKPMRKIGQMFETFSKKLNEGIGTKTEYFSKFQRCLQLTKERICLL